MIKQAKLPGIAKPLPEDLIRISMKSDDQLSFELGP